MFESKTNSNTSKWLLDSPNISTLIATISREHLQHHLNEIFHQNPPKEHLVDALYNRFRPLKIGEGFQGIEQMEEMDIIDFLMACNLLSRVTQDKKIKLMF